MLRIEGLHVFHGKIEAVKGISMTINQGEIVTLIGANGAGKTTVLHTISGLNKATKGKIFFNDKDITNATSPERVKLGISQSPEGRRIFPKMTVYENLEMGAFIMRDKNAIKEDIEKSFVYFPRLKERMKQIAGTLSGGEQQMLAIARSLMSRPKLLLLDEPSLGIAPILVEEIFRILAEIQKNGTTMLIVEQNAFLALEFAQRAYVLETGCIALEGPATEMLNNDHVRAAYLGE